MSSKLLRGTVILSIGTMLSRILGIIFVIPFYSLVGTKGGTLYSYGYVPYTIFISIATVGLPLAVSKFVSKYNTLGEYGIGRKLFKSSMVLMISTGVGACIILYSIAPFIAPYIIDGQSKGNTVEDITTVIRAVSIALTIVPVMSLIRGFFQGHESMGPTSVSQVVEQLVRVVFLLISTYVILQVMDGSVVDAVSAATFAAFVGALGGLAVLIVYWIKRKPYLDELLQQDRGCVSMSMVEIYKELLTYAAPFAFVGLAIPAYQLIDQFTFDRAMWAGGFGSISTDAYGIYNMYVQRLIAIPITLATAFSVSIVPTVTNSFNKKDMQTMTTQLNQTFQVLLFVTLPAVVGMSVISNAVYAMFYEYSDLGGFILRWYAPAAIFMALFSVTAAVMQGINVQKNAVISLVIGLLIKLSLNHILIVKFQTAGSIFATTLGFAASVAFSLYIIQKHTNYSYLFVYRRTVLIVIFTAIMGIGAGIANWMLEGIIGSHGGRMWSIAIVVIVGLVGGAIYYYISYRSGLLGMLLGDRFTFLKKKQLARNSR